MKTLKLTKRLLDTLQPRPTRYTLWDSAVSGFGVRITPNGTLVFVLKYRHRGRQRWLTIGRHGSPWTIEMARREAVKHLGEVAAGRDPLGPRTAERGDIIFAQLCDDYLAEGVTHKKRSTLRVDRGRIEHHLKPLLGAKKVRSIVRADLERMLSDVAAGRTAQPVSNRRRPGSITCGGLGVAARCVELASTILSFAVSRQILVNNPAQGIRKPRGKKLERFLSETEFSKLSVALNEEAMQSANPYPAAAIRLLMFTGCRRGEILDLRWANVDFEHRCLRLPDSKTGSKVVYLNEPALDELTRLPRHIDNPFVIVGSRPGSPLVGLDKVWCRIRRSAGLLDVRLHDIRHSFASVGAAGGLSLPIIGALLGHKHTSTTARYAHLAADPLRAANEAVGQAIVNAMYRGARTNPHQTGVSEGSL